MKILVVAPQPFYQPRGTPFSVYYRLLVTSQLGYQSDLVTYGEGQDVEIKDLKTHRTPRFGFLGNVKIGPSPLKLFLDIFIFLKMLSLLIKNRYKIVHAHEEAVFFAALLKPVFRYKLIYDMHSSLPQQLSNFSYSKSKLLASIFEKLERWALNKSDGIITICPDLQNHVIKQLGDVPHHFLIENSLFDPIKLKENGSTNHSDIHYRIMEQVSSIAESYKIGVYTGTLESYQGIEIVIDAMIELNNTDHNLFITILGGTKEQIQHYQRYIDDAGLTDRFYLHSRVAKNTATEVMSKASLLLSPRSKGTNTPLKIYEQMASGIPIVATDIYSHTQVLSSDVSFLAKPNAKSFSEALTHALTDEHEVIRRTKNAKRLYDTEYSSDSYKKKLKALFEVIST